MFANSDFLFIGIMDGHMEFGYNLGSGVAIVRDNGTFVSNNDWHTVKAERYDIDVLMAKILGYTLSIRVRSIDGKQCLVQCL